MKKNKKSQIWISVIIYTLVALLALLLLLNTGLPLLTEMKDRASFNKIKDIMLDLDRHISEISSQGEGSQSSVSFEIRDGEVKFINNKLIWELETKSSIMSPRSSTVLGNLVISSNSNVNTYEYDNEYIMSTRIKNDTFLVNISRIGSKTDWQNYNLSEVINYFRYNDNEMAGRFEFMLNNDANSGVGNGYTELVPSGNSSNLGRAKVRAHMNSSFGEYDLDIIMESYSDFLTVKIKNFRAK